MMSFFPVIAHAQNPPAAAALVGRVVDSSGTGIPDVEVTLRDSRYAARTDAKGEFTLANVRAARYRALFRRLGYSSVEYNWDPGPGDTTKVTVSLRRIAQTLDPTEVRAEEDRRFASRASIAGIVVDSGGVPIADAEVRIVGGDGAGMTRRNGGFLFKPVAVGAYVLRVRKLGYAPVTLPIDLHEDDDREVYIRMTPLAQGLDPMVVTESSGFGSNQNVWDELERRKRFVEFDSKILGPDDLRKFYGMSITKVAGIVLGGDYRTYQRRTQPQMDRRAGVSEAFWDRSASTCVLINGTQRTGMPDSSFTADQLEMLEIYPVNTELSGTVAKYFGSPPCAPTSLLNHPTYFVVWLKGSLPK
jgi:hypothetical protein